jgi:hypothetical protein
MIEILALQSNNIMTRIKSNIDSFILSQQKGLK